MPEQTVLSRPAFLFIFMILARPLMKKSFIVTALLFLSLFVVSCDKKGFLASAPSQPSQNLPLVTTNTISNIFADSASTGGMITRNGDTSVILESGICYDTARSPYITKSKVINTSLSDTFRCQLSGLSSNTTYYVRAYYTTPAPAIAGAVGTVYGNEVSFTSAKHPNAVGNDFFNGPIYAMSADAVGNIYVGGAFVYSNNSGDYYCVDKWDQKKWTLLPALNGNDYIQAMCVNSKDSLFAGFRNDGTGFGFNIGTYNGSNWSIQGYVAVENYISDLCTDPQGNLYAIGNLKNAAGKYVVAKWGPAGYSEFMTFDELPLAICRMHPELFM